MRLAGILSTILSVAGVVAGVGLVVLLVSG